MTSVWDGRAEAYRRSATHAAGPDLDLLEQWAGDGTGLDALDVATGGGHVARRLEDRGYTVTTIDPSPAMGPTIVSRAEELPFANRCFDLVATRLAAHHFDDVRTALAEMARVSRGPVLVEDVMFMGDDVEAAEAIRDPSHVKNYDEREWRELLAAAGIDVGELVTMSRSMSYGDWLERCGCEGDEAVRCTALLGGRVDGDALTLDYILVRGQVAS
jgi:SAM-dependent methyltransferase